SVSARDCRAADVAQVAARADRNRPAIRGIGARGPNGLLRSALYGQPEPGDLQSAADSHPGRWRDPAAAHRDVYAPRFEPQRQGSGLQTGLRLLDGGSRVRALQRHLEAYRLIICGSPSFAVTNTGSMSTGTDVNPFSAFSS